MSCPSSIRCRDSNPRPFERESPPITTRPGLPPKESLVSKREADAAYFRAHLPRFKMPFTTVQMESRTTTPVYNSVLAWFNVRQINP